MILAALILLAAQTQFETDPVFLTVRGDYQCPDHRIEITGSDQRNQSAVIEEIKINGAVAGEEVLEGVNRRLRLATGLVGFNVTCPQAGVTPRIAITDRNGASWLGFVVVGDEAVLGEAPAP